MAGDSQLTWANGTLAAASNVGQLAGLALVVFLHAFAGAGVAFVANAVSFAVSAAFVAAVRGPFRSENPEAETNTPETGSMWAGVRFLWHNGTLLTLTVVGAVTFLATEIIAVADLPLIHHFGVGGVGLWGHECRLGSGRPARRADRRPRRQQEQRDRSGCARWCRGWVPLSPPLA